jgi:hypothetical protein
LSSDAKTLLLFELQTQKWVKLVTGTIGWLNWSKDGQYLYVLDGIGSGTVLKVCPSDRKVERMADLKYFVTTTGHYNSSLALAPDDSPLLLCDAGTYDVYALDWEEP